MSDRNMWRFKKAVRDDLVIFLENFEPDNGEKIDTNERKLRRSGLQLLEWSKIHLKEYLFFRNF